MTKIENDKFVINGKNCSKIFIKLFPIRLMGGSFFAFYMTDREQADVGGVYVDREKFNAIFRENLSHEECAKMYKFLRNREGRLSAELKEGELSISLITDEAKKQNFHSFEEVSNSISRKKEERERG